MNFGAMLTGLYDDLTYQAVPAAVITARLKRWINEAHQHALRLSGLVGLRQGTLPFLSRMGQAAYGFPQVFERIDAIVEQTNDRRLVYRSRDWYRALDPGERSEGTPSVWVDEGLSPVQRQPVSTGVWAVSDNAADITTIARLVGVRANGDVQVEAAATLTGLTPVQLGTITDYVTILKWELSTPAAGTVLLLGDPGSQPVTEPDAGFPAQPLLDTFDRADENPLSFGGNWASATATFPNPLRVTGMQAGPSLATASNASFWVARLAADFQAYVTVAVLPGVASSSNTDIMLSALVYRTDVENDRSGFHCVLFREPTGTLRLILYHAIPGLFTVLTDTVLDDFEAGDAFGFQRKETMFSLYVRHAGVWRQVEQVAHGAFYQPLYLTITIDDYDTTVPGEARIDDVGAGPLEGQPVPPPDSTLSPSIDTSRHLARMPIGRTTVQYQAIRLWPTPSADLAYTVDGQFLIPTLVNESDVPMLPESYHDMLVCYARFRQYKFNGDETRAAMEHTEWMRWLGSLQAYVEYPQDYRPVMAVLHEDGLRWNNVGAWYPADGWGR
jgi:hypothetical protein